ncbi:MAG TPA: type II and III secretion system protein family protein [Caulobacteraceae bacterium]|nr:type II and III secretion system protein family protein [Caulobacteraceae bacterium]
MSRFLTLVLTLFAWVALSGPAMAQAFSDDMAPTRAISVPKNKSVAFRLVSNAAEVVVTQPEVAQIVANNDRSVYVRGVELGATNILVYDGNHRLLEVIDVNVGYDAAAAQAEITRALPTEKIVASGFAGGILLTGQASTSSAANRARGIAERYAPKLVTNEIMVEGADQVMLEVRIVEADRAALKDFGISLLVDSRHVIGRTNALLFNPGEDGSILSSLYGVVSPAGRLGIGTNIGNTSIDVVLDAMEDKGLIRTLARPNLAAVSGEEAEFLAGGEFPFPVPSGEDNVTIEFKPFGVQLKFTPTVGANNLIRLKVAPEVSALDNTNPLRINGFDVPSMTIRRTSTTVDLRDGDTFAIAGLFQQEYANNVRQVPGLGDIPVLGALFRSSRWRRKETELVVLVTPRLVSAEESRALAPDPLRVSNEPSQIDLILGGLNFDQPMAAPVGGIRGPLP